MKGEQHQIKKAVEQLGKEVRKEKTPEVQKITANAVQKGVMPKDALGLTDAMVEGIYGQAYRLYNTGKYQDASRLFRLLVMLNSLESKYAMGLAACFHMLKEYRSAIDSYTLVSIVDPESPIPFYHTSDCYIQMGDNVSALVALEMAVKRAGEKAEFKTLKDRALLTMESLRKDIAKLHK